MDNSIKKVVPPTDYISEFEYSNETSSEAGSDIAYDKEIQTSNNQEVYKKPKTISCTLNTQLKKEQYEKDYIKHQSVSLRAHLLTMDPYARHKKLVNDYLALHGGILSDSKSDEIKNIENEIKENERFIWHEGDEFDSWGSRLAKKYWDRLFKEYCLIDLTRYKLNKFGMRWRLEKEVVAGKGQFICGDYNCEERGDLRSWEVKFNYVENNEKRMVLVKVRLCSNCSDKLNHHHKRKEVTKFPPKRKLISPVPLDDDVLDKDALSGYNIEDIKNTIKRARRESNRSLTEEEDNNSSGTESQLNQDIFISSTHGDSSHNSVTSSGPSSPLSVSSQSEDESSSGAKVNKKKAVYKEHGFDKYINDLLL